MTKVLLNQTVSPIFVTDVGITIPASPASYLVQVADYPLWAASSDIVTFIGSGDIIVNDGSFNLSKADGIALLQSNFKQIDFVPSLKNNDKLKVELNSPNDFLSKISATDTTGDYLEDKLLGTTNKITLTKNNPGANETLTINIGSNVFDKTVDDASNIVNVPSGNISATDVQSALNELDTEKQALSEKGQANGYASLDGSGKVPSNQLPAFVDDVLEFPNLASFPVTGSTGIIYVALDTNKTYRWSGSTYIEISPSDVNSVFGRTGIVTAQNGDYTASQITNVPAGTISSITVQTALNELDSEKVPNTRLINAGAGLTGGGNLTADRTISMPNVGTPGTYGSTTQVPVLTTDAQGRVSAVTNTNITLTSAAISDFNEAAQDAVGNILTDSASVDFTYNDALNTISASVLPAGVNHNALQNYVANQHVDHSTVNITAGTGLTGGGDITASRTIALANTAVTPGSYGSATQVPTYTVNAQGQLTASSNTSIQLPQSQVTNLVADLLGKANLAGGNTFTGNQTIANAINAAANVTITPGWSSNTGTWINLDTTGPSGIGSGGPGANPFLAYAAGNGQWFTDALSGDVAYRNQTGRLLFGTTSGNSVMRMTGNDLTVGPTGTVLTNNPFSVNGDVNSFLQSNVQNINSGNTASSDIVATANNGTDTNNFINMGVNSSTYADPAFTLNGPGDGYLYVQDGDLSLGSSTANKIVFFTEGTLAANEKARITPTGQFALGVTAPSVSAKLQINSTTQGFLMPRMTSAQRDAIATPAQGLQVYDTDLKTICTFDGSVWIFQIAQVVQNNQSSNSTTYGNITELVTPTLPTGRYSIEFAGAFQSTSTLAGIGIRLNGATVSAINIKWNISQAANGTDSDFQYSQLANTTDVTSASTLTANADFPVSGFGVFSLSAPGTVAAQLRSEVALTTISVRINSALIIRRITG